MTKILKLVTSVAFFLSAIGRVIDALQGLADGPDTAPSVNHKVESVLNSAGLINNPVDAAEEQYIRTVENGLNRSRVDPHIAAFAVDMMRVCPSPRQYKAVEHGPKKALLQGGATNDPWVSFRREAFLCPGEGLMEVTSLVVYIQAGAVEPVAYYDGKRIRYAVRAYGYSNLRYIEHTMPSLGAMRVNGEWSTMAEVFAAATLTPAFKAGKRVPVRVVIARRPHPAVNKPIIQYASN